MVFIIDFTVIFVYSWMFAWVSLILGSGAFSSNGIGNSSHRISCKQMTVSSIANNLMDAVCGWEIIHFKYTLLRKRNYRLLFVTGLIHLLNANWNLLKVWPFFVEELCIWIAHCATRLRGTVHILSCAPTFPQFWIDLRKTWHINRIHPNLWPKS